MQARSVHRSFATHGIGATISAKFWHSVALRCNRCTVATTAAHCCALIAVQASSLESFNGPSSAAAASKRECTSCAMAGAGGDLDLRGMGSIDRPLNAKAVGRPLNVKYEKRAVGRPLNVNINT